MESFVLIEYKALLDSVGMLIECCALIKQLSTQDSGTHPFINRDVDSSQWNY